MKKIITLFLPFVLAACGGNITHRDPFQNKTEGLKPNFIVGGQVVETVKGNPFGAVVLLKIGNGLCSGTLNTPTEISTAAHCLQDMVFPDLHYYHWILQEKVEQMIAQENPGEQVDSIPLNKIKRYVSKAMTDYMKEKAQRTKIYFGNDPASAMDSDFISGIIRDIKGQEEWIESFIEEHILPSSPSLTKKREWTSMYSTLEETLKNDQVTLVLDIPVLIEGIRPIPWIKRSEWEMVHDPSVFAVGFGDEMDPHLREDDLYRLNDLDSTKINKNESLLNKKKIVSLNIQNIVGKIIVLTGEDQKEEGVCMGDSGGPLLVRLANGKFRQIATISSTIKSCGSYTVGVGMGLQELKKML